MKKIYLKSVSDILSDRQMKRVFGGYSGCLKWTDHGIGTCGFKATNSSGGCVYGCGMTMNEAKDYANGVNFHGYYGNWCCDNCGTSTYCS